MEPEFPFEFVVHGTPVSFQSGNALAKAAWKQSIRDSSGALLPKMSFATERPLAVTLYYFPDVPMDGDVDNIVKLILDAMSEHIYIDDDQIERVVVQKFEPDRVFAFTEPSGTLVEAMLGAKPALYVRLSDDLGEGL